MKSKIEDWKSPRKKLDNFLNLYEKIKSDRMLMFTISKKFVGDDKKDEAIKWLTWYRNKFIHFIPSTFAINVVNFPERMLEIIRIAKFLVSESGNILWINHEDKLYTENLINGLTDGFSKLNQYYTKPEHAN